MAESDLSSEVAATTVLPAASGVSATENSNGNIDLSWTVNDDSPDGGQDIERSSDGGSTWTDVATGLGDDTTSYTDTSVSEGVTYEYRVERNTDHATTTSSTVSVTTTITVTVSAETVVANEPTPSLPRSTRTMTATPTTVTATEPPLSTVDASLTVTISAVTVTANELTPSQTVGTTSVTIAASAVSAIEPSITRSAARTVTAPLQTTTVSLPQPSIVTTTVRTVPPLSVSAIEPSLARAEAELFAELRDEIAANNPNDALILDDDDVLQTVITAIARTLDELTLQINNVERDLFIESADEDALDELGKPVDTRRPSGESDGKYRTRLWAGYGRATSDTTIEDFGAILTQVLQADPDTIDIRGAADRPVIIATVDIDVLEKSLFDASKIAELLKDSIASGHNIELEAVGSFEFDGADYTPSNNSGFGDGEFGGVITG